MGIQSSSATFTRFYVETPAKQKFLDHVDKGLKAGAFRELSEDLSQAVGFSSWDDLFDPSFDYASYHKAEYVAFNFRVDRRRVPSILCKQQTRMAIQEYRDKHDGKWPPRQEKDRIREEVLLRLMSMALPEPSACEVAWNPGKQWLLAGSTSKRILDPFWEHLENHLQVYPVPLHNVQWALRLLPPQAREREILNSLVSPESSNITVEGRFLGYEFLTWLWFFSENSKGLIEIADNNQAEIHMGERLILSRPDDGNERVICTTQGSDLHEARTALRHGKMVEEAQLYMTIGENEYFLRLDSELWAIRSLRTPRQVREHDEEDTDGRFLEKMYFLEEVFACLDAAYARFLSERLNPKWDTTTWPQIKKWFEKD